MILKFIFSALLCINCVTAVVLSVQTIRSYEIRYRLNKIYAVFALSSAVWSFGFSLLMLQKNVTYAYYFRSIGIVGTFGYMITAQMLISDLADIEKKKKYYFNGIAFLGIIIYLFAIGRNQTIYFISDFGMTYELKKGIVNNIYSLYFIVVSFNILFIILNKIIKSDLKRLQYFGKRFIIVEICILVGTVLDLIFPLIGYPALPGSDVTQFVGLIIINLALKKIDVSRINIKNTSRYIYHTIGNPVLVFNPDYKLMIANISAIEFFKMDKEGTEIFENERNYEEKIEDLFEADANSFFLFEKEHSNIDTKCKVNGIDCSIEINKIRDEYGDLLGYLMMVNDLTERVKVMESLKEARLEADKASRAKSEFLANMSHEIRTPMNAIMGFAELALQEEISGELKEYLTDIKQSSEGLLGIINDILNISKIESGKLEIINADYEVRNLIKPIYQMVKQLLKNKKDINFEIRVSKHMPRALYGDELRIREILINLLNNAVKYTEQGFINLKIDVINKKDGIVTLEMIVEDSGIGIKEEDINYLFDSFQRVDEEKNRHIEGTGLGLSIVKGYVELMGGTIAVESEYGAGSKFIVQIDQKIVDETVLSNEEIFTVKELEASRLGKLHFDKAKVLVVDDNEVNLKVIEKTLEEYGLEVDTVSNGPDAIRYCSISQYRVVFMDQMMPEMGGEETMKIIRDSVLYYKTTGKIVMLTANAFSNVKDEALQTGFDDYLKKPLEYKELERVLETYLADYKISEETTKEEEQEKLQEKEELEAPNIIRKLLNIEDGILHCAGSEKVYRSALEIVIRNKEKDLTRLENLAKEKKYLEFGVHAHALKGSCLNIGANITGEKARLLEFAGKEANETYIKENLNQFIDEYESLVKEISQYIEAKEKEA